MKILKYPDECEFDTAVSADEPLLVLISFDGEEIIASQIDDAVQDCVLLRRVKGSDRDIDRYFRLVANHEGADRTFVCPPTTAALPERKSA